MKTAHLIPALLLTSFTFFESCKKAEDTPSVTTVESTLSVNLKANESFTFLLPATTDNKSYKILQASLHNANTELVADASGNMQLVYTPQPDYTGTDKITLSTTENELKSDRHLPHRHGSKGEHHERSNDGVLKTFPKLPKVKKDNCNTSDNTTETNILINFNITGDETISSVN